MLKENEKEALQNLHNALASIEYSTYMSLVLGEGIYYQNPLPEYHMVIAAIKKLPFSIQPFAKFLSLGLPIKLEELKAIISIETIHTLKEMDLLNHDKNDVWLNNYILISYCNTYIFVGNVYYYPTCQSKEQIPYIGPDSYWLSRMIHNRVSGKVLDLCSGSGIQAILACKTAENVVAVDIDSNATRMIEVNAVLNGISSNIISICHGNLFEAVENQVFDYIVCNPPFIPIPETVPFPIAGDGGWLGDQIIKNIFVNLKKHLKCDGELLMIGQTIGYRENVHLTKLIHEYLSDFSVNVTYYARSPIEHQASAFAELATIVNNESIEEDKWIENYTRVNATYFYNFLLKCKKNSSKILKENFFQDSWKDSDIPVLKAVWQKAPPTYILSNGSGKMSVTVEEEIIEFLKSINGKSTLYELLESMPLKYRIKYGNNSTAKMLAKYFVICNQLENYSILERRQTNGI